MKTKLQNITLPKIILIFLSLLSIAVLEWSYWQLNPNNLLFSSSKQYDYIPYLMTGFVAFLLYRFLLHFFHSKTKVYLLTHIAFITGLFFCNSIYIHSRYIFFLNFYLSTESFIDVATLLTPLYVESLHKDLSKGKCRLFPDSKKDLQKFTPYLWLLFGYLIIFSESVLSGSFKPVILHFIIYSLCWIYYSKKDYLITGLAGLAGIATAGFYLENRFSASAYLKDVLQRFTLIGNVSEIKKYHGYTYIQNMILTDSSYFYLILCSIFLLLFVITVSCIACYIAKTEQSKTPIIMLTFWLIHLVFQVLYQCCIIPFAFIFTFYGAGHYFLFPYILMIYKYVMTLPNSELK